MPKKILQAGKTRRIVLMDELRGFAVFCMVFYHGFYTLGFLFGNKVGVYFFNFFMPAEPFFAGLFMFISGISSDLSHSNLARGFKLLLVSLALTLVTFVFIREDMIVFGILHFLSVCMILYGFLKPVSDKHKFSWIPVIICAILFFATKNIQSGYLRIFPGLNAALPARLYSSDILSPLGIHSASFQSADYFPIFPWIFVFAAGTFFGKPAAEGKFPEITYRSQVPPLSWFGRHALIIYLVHQPVIYGLCLLFYKLLK